MNAFDAIKTRRSTRSFKPDMIARDKLDIILEAGRYSPSGGNSQTNHFLVVTNDSALRKLEDLVQNAFAQYELTEDMYPSMKMSVYLSKKGDYKFFYSAPVLIIVANDKDYGNNIADCAIAVQDMMIAANELDLGSCYINQLKWLNEDAEINAYLQSFGMKENERVYAAVAIGIPATPDGLPVRVPQERKGNIVTYID